MLLNGRKILFCAVLVAMGLSVHVRIASAQRWWNGKWSYRRTLMVKPAATNLPGDDVAYAVIPTGGKICPDGRDVRVLGPDLRPRPFWIMFTGPGDLLKIAFVTSGSKQQRYYVYYGNPQAQMPEQTWRPRRGVLLETWQYRGGPIGSLGGIRRTFARAKPLIGRAFVPSIFLGHNIFGPQDRTCNLYTGYLICPVNGQYTFATSSNDASFVLLNDQLVVSWPGKHNWVANARHKGTVNLDKGLGKLTYYHVNAGGRGGAVAAWREPSGKRIWPILPRDFAPVGTSALGPLRQQGRSLVADFTFQIAGQAGLGDRNIYRYKFIALGAADKIGTKVQWDFGDGQTATEQVTVEHVFLKEGFSDVSLTIKRGGAASTITNRVYVTADWPNAAVIKPDPLAPYARKIAGYNFGSLPPTALAAAMELLEKAGRFRQSLSVAETVVQKEDLTDYGQTLIECMDRAGDLLLDHYQSPARAVDLYLSAFEKVRSEELKISLVSRACQIILQWLDRPKVAGELLEAFLSQATQESEGNGNIRQLRLVLGDLNLHLGRGDRAEYFYRLAGNTADDDKLLLRTGAYSRTVEDYLSRKEYHAAKQLLDRWENEYPTQRLAGYSSYLRGKLYIGMEQHHRAGTICKAAAGANPDGRYAGKLLLLAVRAYSLGNDRPAAALVAQTLRERYPNSPWANQLKGSFPSLTTRETKKTEPKSNPTLNPG